MATPSNAGSGFDEAGYGGADAVPDTPDTPGHGTEPNQPRFGNARANVRSGGGAGRLVLLVGALALFVALVYLAGFFR